VVAAVPLAFKQSSQQAPVAIAGAAGALLPMFPTSKTSVVPSKKRGGPCNSTHPNMLLMRFSGMLPRAGMALDLACGNGQDTVFLSSRGLTAIGIDRSGQALAAARRVALTSDLKACFVQADLASFHIPNGKFVVVVCFRYRDPNLYPSIRSALKPGGLLIYETYTREHLHFGFKPQNPDHLLERNELLRAFGDWEIVFYQETWTGRGMASLVARKPLPQRGAESARRLQ